VGEEDEGRQKIQRDRSKLENQILQEAEVENAGEGRWVKKGLLQRVVGCGLMRGVDFDKKMYLSIVGGPVARG